MLRPTRTLFTLFLAMSLLGGWTVWAELACGGPCCVAESPLPRAMDHDGKMAVAAGGCCCGNEALPCDLEQDELPEAPPRALVAPTRVQPPAANPLAVNQPGARPVNPVVALRCSGADPPDRSPPDPLYLHHLSLLC